MTAVALARPVGQEGGPTPYARVDRLWVGADPLALSLNESPFPPLPAVRAALIRSIGVANRYPEFLPEQLRRVIAEHIGISEKQVIVGGGATGVTQQILGAVTSPGDRIVLSAPTFDGYPILSRMARLDPILVPLLANGHQDLDTMAAAAANARVATICRPHNPTGTVESAAALRRFLMRVPRDTIVLLDEAYVEFVSLEHRIDSVDLVEKFPNLVVVRTFSKAYGLAGLRVGYAFAAPALADELWSMQMPFGTSTASLVAVVASYHASAQLRRRIRLITRERRRLCGWLQAMGIEGTDTQANFVYLPAAVQPWDQVIGNSAIRVRYYPGGDVRITIGSGSSTAAVIAAMRGRR